jgi:hypothetical protein
MAKFSKDNQPANNGRKKGSLNKTTQLLRDATPAILQNLIEQAKAGDIQAAQIILKHALPTKKPEYTPININITDSMTWSDKAQQVANSALNGECCPSVAIQMINALGSLNSALKVDAKVKQVQESKTFDNLFV